MGAVRAQIASLATRRRQERQERGLRSGAVDGTPNGSRLSPVRLCATLRSRRRCPSRTTYVRDRADDKARGDSTAQRSARLGERPTLTGAQAWRALGRPKPVAENRGDRVWQGRADIQCCASLMDETRPTQPAFTAGPCAFGMLRLETKRGADNRFKSRVQVRCKAGGRDQDAARARAERAQRERTIPGTARTTGKEAKRRQRCCAQSFIYTQRCALGAALRFSSETPTTEASHVCRARARATAKTKASSRQTRRKPSQPAEGRLANFTARRGGVPSQPAPLRRRRHAARLPGLSRRRRKGRLPADDLWLPRPKKVHDSTGRSPPWSAELRVIICKRSVAVGR